MQSLLPFLLPILTLLERQVVATDLPLEGVSSTEFRLVLVLVRPVLVELLHSVVNLLQIVLLNLP